MDVSPDVSLPSLSSVLTALSLQPSSLDDLRSTCAAAIRAVPDAAENVRKGKVQAATRIVGEVMKLSQGRANAKLARDIIVEILSDA